MRLLAVAVLALTLASPALAASPPKVSISDYGQLKTPLPYPYD